MVYYTIHINSDNQHKRGVEPINNYKAYFSTKLLYQYSGVYIFQGRGEGGMGKKYINSNLMIILFPHFSISGFFPQFLHKILINFGAFE